jgi:hypothetical protein
MEFLCNLVFSLLMVVVLLLPDGVVSPSMLWSSLYSSFLIIGFFSYNNNILWIFYKKIKNANQ